MLNAIFEEAEIKSKASSSVASGDWSGWTASELDELVKDGEQADELIGKIIRTGRECPDGLWEALSRKYSREELSGSIASYLVDEGRGKINLHQSFTDRLNDSDLRHVIRSLGQITAAGDRATREVRSTVDGRYHFQRVPWDTSEIEKAKTFIQGIQAAKRKKAALKGLETKKANKATQSEGGLKPIQTEHWHRWMPDEVPTEDTLWEKLRPRLKTQSKLDIDIMLREMEKVGVVTPNQHGNKVFRAAKFQEIMNAPREKFATSHVKNYNGAYANMQMIRGNNADSALISVGMPLALENRWKKEHPKLLKHLKSLRDKKIGGHAAVMKGIRPLGWVRVDKLDDKNWLIEEIQQDLDAIMDEHWAKQAGHDTTGTWGQQHKRMGKGVADLEAQLKKLDDALDIGTRWIATVEKWKPQWDAWAKELPNPKHDPVTLLYSDYGASIHNSKNEEIPGNREWEDLFEKCYNAIRTTATSFGWSPSDVKRLMGEPEKLKSEWLDMKIYDQRRRVKKDLIEAKTQQSEMQGKIDAKHPEPPGALDWQKDIDEMKATIAKFPRWAIHAVKQAAKENNVEKLWWVTYSQKKALGGANPPRSFTSDQLAKKFGFHKVGIDEINRTPVSPGLQQVSLSIERARARAVERATLHSNPDDEDNSDLDQFLWMAPVDQVFTEQTKPLDIGVFG